MNRNTQSPLTRHSDTGNSLISLMIGIALSSITMLAATHMHTSHQSAVNDLNDSITHNRTVLTSLSIIEKEIQSAGYGIQKANQSHILIEFEAATATVAAIRSISWRFMTDDNDDGIHATPHCRKLVESCGNIGGTQFRFLNLIESSSCHANNPIQNTTWDQPIGRLGQWEIKDELATHVNDNNTLFSFQLQSTDCSFPGLDNPDTHLSATIEAPTSAELNGHDLPENGITVCLTNIYP